jgi:hypothetical protein
VIVTTDMLGAGRVVELRSPVGWVWSNRPVAACLFAGTPVRSSERGWRFIGAVDWAMDDTTAYDGVHAVGAATQIVCDGLTRSVGARDVLGELAGDPSDDPLAPDGLRHVADALIETARSVGELWEGRPKLTLSGGRDSRLVAASFIAAEVDARFVTDGRADGEAQTERARPRAPVARDQ